MLWAPGAGGRPGPGVEGGPHPSPPTPRDALEGKGPRGWPWRQLGRRLEEVAKAVGGGYCRLQMPLKAGTWRQGDRGWA